MFYLSLRGRSKPSILTPRCEWESSRREANSGRNIERLLKQPTLDKPPPQWKEADIYDYGVERVLIVERDLLVDLFVRNDFHSQQRVLIMSQTGYPSYLEKAANEVLERQPQTPVFLLHDASDAGMAMKSRMQKTGKISVGQQRIIDLGMTPGDIKRFAKALGVHYSTLAAKVDSLPYRGLANMIALAMEKQLPLSALSRDEIRKYDDGGSFG